MEPGSNSLTIKQTEERHSLRCAFSFISLCARFRTPTVISSNETRLAQSEVDINNFFCAFSSQRCINTRRPAQTKEPFISISVALVATATAYLTVATPAPVHHVI